MTAPRVEDLTNEELLEKLGVPLKTQERWARERERCTNADQIELTTQNHQMEAYLYSRYGRR